MDVELSPRAVLNLTADRITQRTLDLTEILGTNTVASHTMKIYNSSGTDVTSNIGKGSTESSGIITFGIYGYAVGSYVIVFSIVCNEKTPDGTALKFTADINLEVTSTPKTTAAATAEVVCAHALVTLPELKIALGIALDTTTYDIALTHIINDVTDEIERICNGRRFASTAYTGERYNGNNEKFLFLRNYPIISVSSVTMDDETVTAASAYTDYDKYWIEPILNGSKYEGVLFLENKWNKGDRNIVISYTGGYATIPGKLRRAAISLAKEYYHMLRNATGLKSESIGDYSYTMDLMNDKVISKVEIDLQEFKRMGYA